MNPHHDNTTNTSHSTSSGNTSKVEAAIKAVHGVSENFRGAAMGAIDTITHKDSSANDQIAERGRLETQEAFNVLKGQKGAPSATHGSATGPGTQHDNYTHQGPQSEKFNTQGTHTGGLPNPSSNTGAGLTTAAHPHAGPHANDPSRPPAAETAPGGGVTGHLASSTGAGTGYDGARQGQHANAGMAPTGNVPHPYHHRDDAITNPGGVANTGEPHRATDQPSFTHDTAPPYSTNDNFNMPTNNNRNQPAGLGQANHQSDGYNNQASTHGPGYNAPDSGLAGRGLPNESASGTAGYTHETAPIQGGHGFDGTGREPPNKHAAPSNVNNTPTHGYNNGGGGGRIESASQGVVAPTQYNETGGLPPHPPPPNATAGNDGYGNSDHGPGATLMR